MLDPASMPAKAIFDASDSGRSGSLDDVPDVVVIVLKMDFPELGQQDIINTNGEPHGGVGE
ncbi:hypothetical protein OHU25_32385 [Streptomyces sp. NBC_00117]|jgi:hypothetical protein|uniref:hypothetical protein n=1 Tax=unclassified Streptomyces TaxID=2593676 RepID=UPI003245C5BD